jgi:alkylhydroperoxidase/carboxymuconolactone decarboxylase family protein YurZ
MTEEEMIKRGQEMFAKCYGGVIPVPEVTDPKGFPATTLKMFHEHWGDGRLSFREKRFVVLGALAGKGADPALFGIHAKSALRNGEISADELRGVVHMTIPYVGYPHASPLFVAVEKLIAEHEKARGS